MTEKKSGDSGTHRIAFDEVGEPVTPERAVHDARNAQLKSELRLGIVARALRACTAAMRAAIADSGSKLSDETRVRFTEALMRSEGILDRYGGTADDKPKEG